ncbi:MAG TPA: Uma2 family endonuclease [Gemmataceae bacterium]|jgi:Uma2 family endonuclease|nr:Uma2 family endonuclease [Gemmataceae bacterium]
MNRRAYHPVIAPLIPSGSFPVIATDIPIMYEDEGQEKLGETLPHSTSIQILTLGLRSHFAPRPVFHVISNMNVHYSRLDRKAYISPDVMVVNPPRPLPKSLRSYRIGKNKPAPLVTIEVLSRRSFQQQDLSNKPEILSELGIREYLLVDVTSEFLPTHLERRELQANGSWVSGQDPDGGITSELGFRIVMEDDGQLRVLERATGRKYLRPDEAEDARSQAEQRIRELEDELERLRAKARKRK